MSTARIAMARASVGGKTLLFLLFLVFIVAPTFFVFPLALTSNDVLNFPPHGISLRHFADVVHSPVWRQAFVTSFEVAGAAAGIATVIGTLAAAVFPGRHSIIARPLEMAVIAPLVIPPIVLAVAWYSLFSRLNLVGTTLAVILGHSVLGLPVVYLNVLAALSSLDRKLVLAARSLGASPAVAFLRVIVPLVAPAIVAGAILAFVLSFDELIITLLVGGGVVNTLPIQLWAAIGYNATPEIAAVASFSVLLTLTGFILTTILWRLRASARR
jgi:putative spermidine/putrescine transport system permease protein